MRDIHCFTSISFNYLDRARVLAATVKQHHPDWTLWLCLSDREPPGFIFNLDDEDFDGLVRIEELGIPDLESWVFCHNVVELCTAVKGNMLCKLFDLGAKKVVYLDPDIALFDSIEAIPAILNNHSVVLTPHLLSPEPTTYGIEDNEIGSLKHGVYNLGFLAVRNCSEGQRLARWWRDRLLDFCYDDISAGLFTDQRWCDLIPAFFPGTHILRDAGYNVACWNLSNRPITFDQNGDIRAGDNTLRFFHFTKVDSVGEAVIERYSCGRHEVFELLHWYRQQLAAKAVEGLPESWWAFGTYSNGEPILREDRSTYRKNVNLRVLFPNPFETGKDSFHAWCTAHLR